MKVRVCPRCGGHNQESAWHCVDCGATLPLKTLVDLEDGQAPVVPFGGQPALSNISPHFQQDVIDILESVIQGDESIVWGCDITQVTRQTPLSSFLFGYLILTSDRLICVRFSSAPMRPCLEIWPRRLSGRQPFLAVDCPRYPLTQEEKASRMVAIYDLGNLASGDVTTIGCTEVFLNTVTLTFHQGKKITVAFYTPQEATEACRLLAAHLPKGKA